MAYNEEHNEAHQTDEKEDLINNLKRARDYEAVKKAKTEQKNGTVIKYAVIGIIIIILVIEGTIKYRESNNKKDARLKALNIKLEQVLKDRKYKEAEDIAQQICSIRNTKENQDKLSTIIAQESFEEFVVEEVQDTADKPKYIKSFYNDVILILQENLKLKEEYNSLYNELEDKKLTADEFTQGINTLLTALENADKKIEKLKADYKAFDEFTNDLYYINSDRKSDFASMVSLIKSTNNASLKDIDKSLSSSDAVEESTLSKIKAEAEKYNLDSSAASELLASLQRLDSPEKSVFEIFRADVRN